MKSGCFDFLNFFYKETSPVRFLLNNVVFVAALELLKNAIAKAGYTDKIVIGMDVAASEFYKGGKYDLDFKSPDDPSRYISPDKLADLYRSFVKDYPGGFLTHILQFTALKYCRDLMSITTKSQSMKVRLVYITGREFCQFN